MHALENGAVVLDVWENYAVLAGETEPPVQPEELSEFLNKVYTVLEGAALEELLKLSQEDNEWSSKRAYGESLGREWTPCPVQMSIGSSMQMCCVSWSGWRYEQVGRAVQRKIQPYWKRGRPFSGEHFRGMP